MKCHNIVREQQIPFQIMSNNVTRLLQFIILGEIIKGIRDACCSVPVADRMAPGEVCQCKIFLQYNESTVWESTEATEASKTRKKEKKNSTPHKIGKYLMRSNKAVKNKLHTKYALTEKLNYSIFIKKKQEFFGMLKSTLN